MTMMRGKCPIENYPNVVRFAGRKMRTICNCKIAINLKCCSIAMHIIKALAEDEAFNSRIGLGTNNSKHPKTRLSVFEAAPEKCFGWTSSDKPYTKCTYRRTEQAQ